MPSKKHLDSQGSRRAYRRRAVQLNEILRGDDEPNVRFPVPQAESQNTIESSIGTISTTELSASCVTMSPVVTPDLPTDEPEKMSQSPSPSTPVSVWQLSFGENDSPQGKFMPDHKAFPSLGKQGKKSKPIPDASKATGGPLDSAKARRGCSVLGNFLPESLLPEAETKPASPLKLTILKRETSQQPKDPDCRPEQEMQSEENAHEPSSTEAVAVDAVLAMDEQKAPDIQQQKCPERVSEKKKKQKSPKVSLDKIVQTKALKELQAGEEFAVKKTPIKPEISPRKRAAVAALAVPAMKCELAQQKEPQQQKQKSPGSFTEKKQQLKSPGSFTEKKQQQKSPASYSNKKLKRKGPASPSKQEMSTKNPCAREGKPLKKFQAGEDASQISLEPKNSPKKPTSTVPVAVDASQQKQHKKSPKNSPRSLSAKKILQKSPAGSSELKKLPNKEANPLVERQNLSGNGNLCVESNYSTLEALHLEQAGERETAGGLLPLIRRSSLNPDAQEFRPMVREPAREQEQLLPGGGGPCEQLAKSKLKRRRRSQRLTRSAKRGRRKQVNDGSQLVENNEVPAPRQLPQQLAVQKRARHGAGQSHRALPYRAPVAQQQQQLQQQQLQQNQQQQQLQQQHQLQKKQQQQQQLPQQQQRHHQQQLQHQQQRQQQQQLLLQQRQQQRQHQQLLQQQLQQQQLQYQQQHHHQEQHQQRQLQYQQLQQQQHQQQHHRSHLAAPLAHCQLHQNHQVYPVYVAVSAVPTIYGPSPVTPLYVATSVYAAAPATSLAALDYVAAPATLE